MIVPMVLEIWMSISPQESVDDRGANQYPELGEGLALKIQRELEYFTRRHPNVIPRRLFLFNHPFEEGAAERYPQGACHPQLAGGQTLISGGLSS